MSDPTENIRRTMVNDINSSPKAQRTALEAQHGRVWTTDELTEEFEVLGFMAPFVAVRRKSDGKKGSLLFQANPRFYFCFKED